MKRFAFVLAAMMVIPASLGLLAGCGSFGMNKISQPFNDAPRSSVEDKSPADIVTMPDGFSNLSTKCGPGGMRYTVVFHNNDPYGSVNVVTDPTCKK